MGVAAGFLGKICKLASALAVAAGIGLATLAATPAEAQQNVYVAAGIPVDITGDLATLREQAMLKGQREGLKRSLTLPRIPSRCDRPNQNSGASHAALLLQRPYRRRRCPRS